MAFSFKDRSTGLLKPSALRDTFSTGAAPKAPAEVLSPGQRRAAMTGLDAMELKWSKSGLTIAAVLGVALSLYLATHRHRTVKVHGHLTQVPISGTYLLLGGIVLAFCVVGYIGLRRRKRTLLVFSFFITGFAFTLIFAPVGLAFIVMGGWLMLRAYRIQKFGTPNAKQAARQAAVLPPRRERKAAAVAASKPKVQAAPKANKRYTPKAPPRKRVPKPTE
jgi:hypothetical protein